MDAIAVDRQRTDDLGLSFDLPELNVLAGLNLPRPEFALLPRALVLGHALDHAQAGLDVDMAQVGMRCEQLAELVRKADALASGVSQHPRQFFLRRGRYAELVLDVVFLLDYFFHGFSL